MNARAGPFCLICYDVSAESRAAGLTCFRNIKSLSDLSFQKCNWVHGFTFSGNDELLNVLKNWKGTTVCVIQSDCVCK